MTFIVTIQLFWELVKPIEWHFFWAQNKLWIIIIALLLAEGKIIEVDI